MKIILTPQKEGLVPRPSRAMTDDEIKLERIMGQGRASSEFFVATMEALGTARNKGLPITAILKRLREVVAWAEQERDAMSDAYERSPDQTPKKDDTP